MAGAGLHEATGWVLGGGAGDEYGFHGITF